MYLLSPEEILVNARKKKFQKDKKIKSVPFKPHNENLD